MRGILLGKFLNEGLVLKIHFSSCRLLLKLSGACGHARKAPPCLSYGRRLMHKRKVPAENGHRCTDEIGSPRATSSDTADNLSNTNTAS